MISRRILITGGTGFVGANLVRRCVAEGYSVHILVRKNSRLWRIQDVLSKVSLYESDLSDSAKLVKIVKKIQPTHIYHLAAYGAYESQNDFNSAVKTNIEGTYNLLSACGSYPYLIFVNTGSSSEYGFKAKAMKETDALEPGSYYAITKASQTHLCSYVAKRDKKPIITFRLFSVYGPYEEPTRLTPVAMKHAYESKPLSLVSPRAVHDFVYVNDVVDAYLSTSSTAAQGEVFNIGTGIESNLRTFVVLLQKATRKKIECKWGAMKSRQWDTLTHWYADTRKTNKILCWRAKTSLEKGLSSTWRWYLENRNMYETSK